MYTLYTNNLANLFNALVNRKYIQGIYNPNVIEFINLFNVLNSKGKIIYIYAVTIPSRSTTVGALIG